MKKDERDLLDVLKFELEFLEKGGYGNSPREPWRFQHIFEDSPACMNYDCRDTPGPCSDCVLMQLVPSEARETRIPCRHIQLNTEGETLDSLYRYADQNEIDETYGKWLRTTIATLEEARLAKHDSGKPPTAPSSNEAKGESLFEKMHPKCANPACVTAFHWLGGGKFLRFRRGPNDSRPEDVGSQSLSAAPSGSHEVKHYWLCERCSHIFTLAYDESQGVVLKLLWPEFPSVESPKELPDVIPSARAESAARSHHP